MGRRGKPCRAQPAPGVARLIRCRGGGQGGRGRGGLQGRPVIGGEADCVGRGLLQVAHGVGAGGVSGQVQGAVVGRGDPSAGLARLDLGAAAAGCAAAGQQGEVTGARAVGLQVDGGHVDPHGAVGGGGEGRR